MTDNNNIYGEEQKRTRPNFVSNYDSRIPVEYQIRAIAFFDILGWRQAVEDSALDPDLRKNLLNAVWYFSARMQDYIETETTNHPSLDEYSQFSDSLIVSFPYENYYDLYRLLKFVTEFQGSMLMSGLPLRGGVTVGALFHMDAIAFGPAMNRAYYLESKIAKVPRVIIDPELDAVVKEAASKLPKHWSFVIRDDAGYYETDFLTIYAKSERVAQIIDCKIDTWIEKYHSNESILMKYQWLKSRWEATKSDARSNQYK